MKRHPNQPLEGDTKKAVEDYLLAKGFMFIRNQQMRVSAKDRIEGRPRFIKLPEYQLGCADYIVFRKPVFRNYADGKIMYGPGLDGMQLLPAVACEIKSWRGTLSHDQIAWRERWLETGGIYLIVRKVEDIEEILS